MGAVIRCAGAIVVDAQGRLLLVRRAHEPGRGLWSVPGGRCEDGESAADACMREVAEETGLVVRIARHVGSVERPAPAGDRYAIDDYLCEVTGGVLTAGDDATEARWVAPGEVVDIDLVEGLLEALRAWRVWPI